jgi:hypothetical protein
MSDNTQKIDTILGLLERQSKHVQSIPVIQKELEFVNIRLDDQDKKIDTMPTRAEVDLAFLERSKNIVAQIQNEIDVVPDKNKFGWPAAIAVVVATVSAVGAVLASIFGG